MTARIQIPANLRQFTEGQSSVEVVGDSVGDTLSALTKRYPSLREKLLTVGDQPHSFVNIFVGGRSIRDLDGMQTPLTGGETILIVPALAGG